MKSYLNRSNIRSLGIRNNNPMNLRKTYINWKGEVVSNNAFEQFSSLAYGIRAGALNVLNKLKKGRTLTSLINEYAPPHENKTQAYINYIAKLTGLPKHSRLSADRNTLFKLTRAICNMENYPEDRHLVSNQDINAGLNLLNNHFHPSEKARDGLLFTVAVAGLLTYSFIKYSSHVSNNPK
ncbi:hypothetical protein [Aureibacter tunicatorum]|uniref:Uncharacterized protein n=1 Tax=Aureibacter tunicatorum TaxID=866807 RepID=A0AAE4BTH4_9BACT|nr:hypothetical protein [Aureibacter tunicatorum]MDR6239935.1 hypothetical protein [Aureibacter tunicatorum]BDD04409.1 hypothetical protein AUTU_18920 [Aureibacter tunicatorum]